jgi:hypothetical protein
LFELYQVAENVSNRYRICEEVRARNEEIHRFIVIEWKKIAT